MRLVLEMRTKPETAVSAAQRRCRREGALLASCCPTGVRCAVCGVRCAVCRVRAQRTRRPSPAPQAASGGAWADLLGSPGEGERGLGAPAAHPSAKSSRVVGSPEPAAEQ